MINPEDGKRFDLAARAFARKASAEAHRLQAGLTGDLIMQGIHIAAAATYEVMAHEFDKTAKRIAEIDQATARARTRISIRSKSQPSRNATPESIPEEPNSKRSEISPAHLGVLFRDEFPQFPGVR